VAALIVIVGLLTPQVNGGRTGDARLSSHHAGALGARLLYETAGRLGWHAVQRDDDPLPTNGRGTVVHALLAPPLAPTPEEAHAYLEAVRAGDGLLFVLDRRNPLSDSLGVSHSSGGGTLTVVPADTAGCPGGLEIIPPLWPDGQVHLWALRWSRGAPPARTTFAVTSPDLSRQRAPSEEAASGFSLGRGRVVVVADPDLLRNDVIRRCAWGADVVAVRMLEWLRAGGEAPRTTLVFDEYHQGFGETPTLLGTAQAFLVDHPFGRMLLQIVLAALVLLLAVGPRALPPVDVLRVERRDPLEQIDALAHAYEQVRATRTLAARLVRGLRSRVERTWSDTRARPNEEFLADAASRAPALAPDVALVQRALDAPMPERTLPELGAALRRIEQTLTTTPNA
jgi:hypothetical protein